MMDTPLLPERYVYVDLDNFVPAVYLLWRHGGLVGVLATAALHTLTMTSVAALCYILVECVDYGRLLTGADLLDAVNISAPTTFPGWLFVVVLVAVVIPLAAHGTHMLYWLVRTHRRLADLFGPGWDIRDFSWGAVTRWLADKLGAIDHSVTQTSMAQRLTRHKCYLGAMVRSDLFTLRCGHYEVPCMTHVLEWVVTTAVLPVVPGDMPVAPGITADGLVRYSATAIRRRSLVVMVLSLLALPVALLFVAVYYVIRYGQLLRLSPSFVLSRHWSLYALWYTWKPLEVKHQALERLQGAREAMRAYATSPPGAVSKLALRAAMFYASLVCVALVVVMLVRDDFTDVTLAGNSLLWWVAIGAAVYAAAKSVVGEEPPQVDREALLSAVCDQLDLTEGFVRTHWPCLYEYRLVGFVKEMATLAALPLVTYAAVYRQADTLALFVLDHTQHVEGVGNVFAAQPAENVGV